MKCHNLIANGGSKADPSWEHDIPIDGNKNRIICKYCEYLKKSGGVTRLKYHLTGINPSHNVQHCESVPLEVKSYIVGLLKGK